MVICKETLLKEIEGSKKAIESMKSSIEINKIVLQAFETELRAIEDAEEISGELIEEELD